MKKSVFYFCLVGLCILLFGCEAQQETAESGRIGDKLSVSREMAAKTMALAFYNKEELSGLEQVIDFPDVSEQDWAYPYINGAVHLGLLSGDEDGNFYPKKDLTLTQAQYLMDRLAPEYESKIVLNESNKNMPISYSLWVQLLETALTKEGTAAELSAYGITEQTYVLLDDEIGLFDHGIYGADGISLSAYRNTAIRFWEKDGEIAVLLEVVSLTPTIENIYCRASGKNLVLETGAGAVSYPCRVEAKTGICDVTLTDGNVTELQAAAELGNCTVKRVNGQEIYLAEQGLLSWADGFRIYDSVEEQMETQTVSKLTCGMDNAVYYLQDGKIAGAVITKKDLPQNIRVLIGGAGQKKVTLSAEQGFTLSSKESEKAFGAGEDVVLTGDLPWFDAGMIEAKADTPISVTFTDGTRRVYNGSLELERRQDGICIINELPLETYLKGVVPNEMPVSFGETALQAQAISARSYAYNQMLANSYCGYGAHLSDTISSQVYLGNQTDPLADAAVEATAGKCLSAEGNVVTTYFYSTSCGYGAAAGEVWSKDGSFAKESASYLKGGSQGLTGARPQNEAEWMTFFQNWDLDSYDAASPWNRWKVYFGAGQLTEIIEKMLPQAIKRNPKLVYIQKEDGSFCMGVPENMGRLKGVSVVQRGESGVVQILQLDYENGAVQLKTEYTIRQVLSPMKQTKGDPIYVQRKDGASLTTQNMLPSGYFAVRQMRNEEGRLTGVALYGGGNGHGVGMSQYGASGMAQQGKTAEEILTHYFAGTQVTQITEVS